MAKKSLTDSPNHTDHRLASLRAVEKFGMKLADPSLPTLAQLTGCKFPIGDVRRGDGAEQRFCGEEVSDGPYCRACRRKAFGFVSERGRGAVAS